MSCLASQWFSLGVSQFRWTFAQQSGGGGMSLKMLSALSFAYLSGAELIHSTTLDVGRLNLLADKLYSHMSFLPSFFKMCSRSQLI